MNGFCAADGFVALLGLHSGKLSIQYDRDQHKKKNESRSLALLPHWHPIGMHCTQSPTDEEFTSCVSDGGRKDCDLSVLRVR